MLSLYSLLNLLIRLTGGDVVNGGWDTVVDPIITVVSLEDFGFPIKTPHESVSDLLLCGAVLSRFASSKSQPTFLIHHMKRGWQSQHISHCLYTRLEVVFVYMEVV